MKMFALDRWNLDVPPIEVSKVTASFVTLPTGRREAINSEYRTYLPTEQEAIAAIKFRLLADEASALATLARAQEKLAEFKSRYPEAK